MHGTKNGRNKPLLAAIWMAVGFLLLGAPQAGAIDICGNGICATTAVPPESCSSCPLDCGPCPPPPPPPPPAEFGNLLDPSDSVAGRIVASGVRVPFENFSHANFGQERLVASNLSIAVDPTNNARVYVAWADYPGGNPPYTLHVRRSDNSGSTWTGDLLTISNATNPALAVNSAGKVAFLYQHNTPTGAALANQRWVTHVRRSTNQGGTWDDTILANTPAATPVVGAFIPYIGDYAYLQAIGRDFYGVFSASNIPDLANFPQGVVYQRSANFNTRQLFRTNGTTVVTPSIDPFFFHIIEP